MQSWEIRWNDWVRIIFGNMPPLFLIEVGIRVVFIYVLIIFCIRLMGKRMASQLSRNELVAISSLAASIGIPIQTPDRGLLPALLVALIVVASQRIVAARLSKSSSFERRTQGNISILVDDCCLNLEAMTRVRISRQELYARLRSESIKHLGQVKRFYFEAEGDFTLIKNAERQAGLSVLPREDPAFRQAQRYTTELRVCVNCGTRTREAEAEADHPCTKCGQEEYEYPMI